MALSPLIQNRNEFGDPIGPVNELGGALPLPEDAPLATTLKPLITPRMQREAQLEQQLTPNAAKPQGFWQNVRHIAATIGNVAGDVFTPATMAMIPGTQLGNAVQHNARSRELAGLQADDRADATSASENSLRGAQTAASEEATREAPGKAASEEALQSAEANKANQPDLAQAYAHAVSQAIKNGGDPSTDPVVQHLADAITAIQKQPVPKGAEHVNIEGPNGKPLLASYDPVTRQTTGPDGKVIANPVPYEKPPQISVTAQDASLDRLAGRLSKPYQAGFDAANKQLENIDKTMRSIDSGYKGQALALPETMTALVSGQGTGVRVTNAELQRIGVHNGVKGDVEAFINRVSGEGDMTAEDKRQLKGILNEARQVIAVKQQIMKDALDGTNEGADRAAVGQADMAARQKLSDYELHGFYIGQQTPKGKVVGFDGKGKVLIDDAR